MATTDVTVWSTVFTTVSAVSEAVVVRGDCDAGAALLVAAGPAGRSVTVCAEPCDDDRTAVERARCLAEPRRAGSA